VWSTRGRIAALPPASPWYNGGMTENDSKTSKLAPPPQFDRDDDITLRAIRRYAGKIAARFQPDKIILFGSHAYGTPHADSDVDLLVIMPAASQHAQAVRIRTALPAPFAMDLIVRTPKNLGWRLAEGESFHTEVVTRGMVLYEKSNTRVGSESRSGLERRRHAGRRERTVT
jgi:predicted nucleotidyltransferase